MGSCSICGKGFTKAYPGNTCQGCYKYFRSGGIINPLPNPGEITLDDRGYVICHICGRSYKRLGSHAKESHGLTIAQYKEHFGLCNNSRTTEANYSNHMKELAIYYDMPDRLMNAGFGTRIKKGDKTLRLGKQVRLQECLDKKRRQAQRRNCVGR